MKKYFIAISGFLLPLVSMANGMHEEDMTIGYQLGEMMPFEHFGEGHWFAAILSIIFWVSLVYTIYSLIQKFRKTQ